MHIVAAQDGFEKRGLAENCHVHGTANLRYLEAINCHFGVVYVKFGPFLSRIQSYFIFCPLHYILRFHGTRFTNTHLRFSHGLLWTYKILGWTALKIGIHSAFGPNSPMEFSTLTLKIWPREHTC